MADRTVAGAGGSTSLRGLRERMVAAAQAIAEERRNQSGANSFAAHSPNLKSTCKPVIDGSVLKNDLKQKLAKERREERKRQQEANKETQLLEKERKSKLQFEKQLEEKQRKLREQKEKDERRRISAEEKRKQKLEEERERYKAVLSRTLERSNRFDQRQKRWSWEGSVMVNSENKSGKTENKRSSSLNRRENKIHSSTDIKPMEDKPARRFHNPQENNLINRLLVPTRASVARSKSAASLSIQGKDIPGITHLFHYVNVPLRSRSSDELKTSMMFCKAAIKVPLQTKLEIAPLEKVETPLKMNVEAFPNTSTEVPPKTSTDVPPMANTEVLPKAHTEVPPKARTDVLSMASIEVPPKPGPEVQPKASIEVPCDMSADPPPMLSMDVSPVVSAKTSPVVSVETSPLVSVETSPVVSMDDSPEVSLDTSPEVSMDTSPEANMEVFLEESMEATPEVNVEVTPEFNVEATTEFDVEANTEFDVEAALEFDVEATPEVSVEATPEVSVEATPEVNVEATPEVSVEATSEVGVEVTPEVNVEATPSENVETTPKENVEVPPEASVEAPNKESVEAPPEGNVAASPKESMKAPPEVIVEVPPKATPKKPEMDKKISNPVPKKRLSSSIPSYRWPSPPARGYHPPSSRNTIRHSQKTHHLSSSPALSKQSAQPSMNYKIIPVQRTLFVPNALGTANKKRETVYTAPNKCEPVSQKHMTLQESGNRSTPGTMSAEEATRILAEKRRLARAQKDKEGGTLQSEMTPSLNRKVPVTVEKVDEVQVKEVSRCEDEQQEKEIEKNKGCQHHEDQEVLLQKGDAKIKAQEEADKRKKERERIMLQNLQERLERKKRIEEIMKRTRKTSVNASKVTETSSNNISEEGEADDEDETESDEDSLDEMFPSAIGNGKHKMPYKNAMRKPQKLVFLQDTTGQILKDKKVYFNGDVKIFKQKGPKDTLTQAKGSRLFTKRTSTRTTKTGKAKETNATVQSTLSVNTNQIIDINSHNTESPATNSTPDSHKHNLKDSMTSHQSPLVPLDHKKRSKSVSTLSGKASSHLHIARKSVDLELPSLLSTVPGQSAGKEEASDI